jgi:prepilin-type N-terminal cleavage/methylation domain-containing protein
MKNKGFTLLELLVVIGIIGVLVALATVAYSSAQVGGRNARRKQDLVAIQSALEQYYSENSFKYPVDSSCQAAIANMKSSWPVDPNTETDYELEAGSCGDGTTYCICANLEPTGTATSGNSGADCDWTATGKTHYCIGNLQ